MNIVLAEERSGRLLSERAFEGTTIKIGRDPSACQIVFDQREWPMVSRRHAEFRFRDGRCLIFDLNSSFGTFVDGLRMREPAEVRPGMRVQFGVGGPVLRIINIELESTIAGQTTLGIPAMETQRDMPYAAAEDRETEPASETQRKPSRPASSGPYCHLCGSMMRADEAFCRECGAWNPSGEREAGAAPQPTLTDAAATVLPPPAARSSENTGSFENIQRTFENTGSMAQTSAPVGAAPSLAADSRRGVESAAPRARAARQTADTSSALEAVRDVVRATVYAPPAAPPGDSFLVQVFAHLQEQETQVDELARKFDKAAQQRGYGTLKERVTRGSKLMFHLTMPGFEINDPVQELMWYGTPESVQFSVHVPADYETGNVIGTVIVSCEGNPIGHVKFTLAVISATAWKTVANNQTQTASDWKRYGKAFISYASQDRKEVLKRVQMLGRLRIQYFQDVLRLEPGERWEQQLYRYIDESDLFLLFWSSAAKRSEWVIKEVRYALKRKAADAQDRPEIMPVIIEGPPPIEPPPELSHIHFNDYVLYFMNTPKRGWWEWLKRLLGLSST